MKRLILALILCLCSVGFAYCDEEIDMDMSDGAAQSADIKGSVSENRFILSEPEEIYLPKEDREPTIMDEFKPILYENALDSNGKFTFSLKYYGQDTQYLHRYKAVDRLDANYDGKVTDNVDYKVGVTAKNLNTIDGNQTVVSNTYVSVPVGKNQKLAVGNARLSSNNGNLISFMEDAEYAYGVNDLGVRLSGNLNKFDYLLGAYNFDKMFSSNQGLARGGVVSVKPFENSRFLNSFRVGGAYYEKEIDNQAKNTYGAFSSYKWKNIGFRSEVSRSLLTGDIYVDNWNFMPEWYISKNLTLRAKHKQYADYDAYVDEFMLDYALGDKIPKLNNVNFQLKTSKTRDLDNSNSQKYGFSIKFNF